MEWKKLRNSLINAHYTDYNKEHTGPEQGVKEDSAGDGDCVGENGELIKKLAPRTSSALPVVEYASCVGKQEVARASYSEQRV